MNAEGYGLVDILLTSWQHHTSKSERGIKRKISYRFLLLPRCDCKGWIDLGGKVSPRRGEQREGEKRDGEGEWGKDGREKKN